MTEALTRHRPAYAWWGAVDKEGWGEGPWTTEPDKVQWYDRGTGLPCLAVRGSLGGWCGYVGVGPGHPWHGVDAAECTLPTARPYRETITDWEAEKTFKLGDKEIPSLYSEDPNSWYQRLHLARKVCGESWCAHRPEGKLDVHGGITFSGDFCSKGPIETSICHTPQPGEPPVWWMGFDCGHYMDLMPKWINDPMFAAFKREGEYRTLEYVLQETTWLAVQLAMVLPLALPERASGPDA